MTSNGRLYAMSRKRSMRGFRRACAGVLPDTISVRIGAERTRVRNGFVHGGMSEVPQSYNAFAADSAASITGRARLSFLAASVLHPSAKLLPGAARF